MYSPEPKCTVQIVTGDFIFTSRPIVPFFLSYSCFSRNRTNRKFSTNLENPDRSEFSEALFDPSEFLTHIILDVIFHELHNCFMYQENMHICNSHNLYLLHMNYSILRRRCANMLIK
jgi:hypothetical protein